MLPLHHKRIAIAAASICLILIFSGCSGKASGPKFDGENAFKRLKQQCDFGPRPLGTNAHEKTGDFLAATLKQYADQVFEHRTRHNSKSTNRAYTVRNIFGVFGKDGKRWVLLLAHWDTRPMADEEIDHAKAAKPILGANDGASGVAVLLEMARLFSEKRPNVGVIIAFVDGEDFGATPDEMFIGSKAFAQYWKDVMKPVSGFKKFDYGILLDMVGDKDLEIHREMFSAQKAPEIVDKVWKVADELGYKQYFKQGKADMKYMIQDDHLPLLAAGIKCIDIIDFDYAYWHTLDDTVDKCSPESLRIVGDVVTRVVYSEPAFADSAAE
ncbi:MAG: M28 family peptidase [Armatimonadota bacterium]|nr:M28 family peptidase [Armatimonadota bacterium]